MKILTKKILREFRFNKFRSITIFLTICLSVSFLVGFPNGLESMKASLEENERIFNNADLRIRLNDFINSSTVPELKNDPIIVSKDVQNVEGRIFLYAEVSWKGKSYAAYWIAVNSTRTNQPDINILKPKRGDNYFINEDDILIGAHFAIGLTGNGIKVNDTLQINYGIINETLNVRGIVTDSDYYYVVNENTGMPEMGNLCVFYTSLKTAQNLLGINDSINEIIVDTKDRDVDAVNEAAEALTNYIGNNKIQKVIRYDKTADREMFKLDAEPLGKMGYVFGVFGLVTAAIVIYNSLSKLIISQRMYIGLFGALGSKKREILLHFVSFGTILGLIGILGGLILSLGFTFLISELLSVMYMWEGKELVLTPLIFIIGSILPIIIVIMFSAFSAWPSLNMTPREAMQPPYSVAQKGSEPIVEKIVKYIPGFRSLVSRIPLRTVFMKGNRKRTISTILAIASSMIILVGSWGMFFNMFCQIDLNFNYYKGYNVSFVLSSPVNETESIDWIKNNINGIDEVEGYIFTELWVSKLGYDSALRFPFEAFHENTQLRRFGIKKGEHNFSSSTCMIGKQVADQLNVSLNDNINISSIGWTGLQISGITQELIDTSIFWSIEALSKHQELFGFGGNFVNGFIFSYTDDANRLIIENQIKRHFTPIIFNDTDEAANAIERLMEILIGVLIIIAVFGLLILGLFTFATMSLALMDREVEFLSLRAQGIKRRKILWIITMENFIYGTVGFIFGIPLCLIAIKWAFEYIIPEWYIPVFVPLDIWGFVLFLIYLSVFLSSLLIALRTWRSSIPDFLRNRMIS